MKTGIARLYRFKASHSLPGFAEPWATEHEHLYTVEVEKTGELVGDVIINTDRIDERWADLVGGFEGKNLNETLRITTTVEQIAALLLELFGADLADRVTVWEDDERWGRAIR